MEDQLKNFNEMYAREVLPRMVELEPLRQQKLREYKKIKLFWQLMIIIPIVLSFLITAAFMFDLISYRYIFLAFFILFVAPFSVLKYIEHTKKIPNEFKKLIKDKCMPHILPCFENLNWQSFEIDDYLLVESGLFSSFYQVRKDDIYTGKYNDTVFQVEEAQLLSSGDKYADGTTVFQGVIINFPSNKPVKSQTIITSKNDSEIINTQFRANDSIIIFSIMTCICFIMLLHEIKSNQNYILIIYLLIFLILLTWLIYDRNRKLKRYQKVNLEDIGFDKRFAVHSKDQIEARYLVTPAFMERMKDLQTAFGTKDIKCSFFDDKIMFAIASDKDLFEIGDLFTPMTDSNQIYQLRAELTSIYKMIDYFKLAEKTGL